MLTLARFRIQRPFEPNDARKSIVDRRGWPRDDHVLTISGVVEHLLEQKLVDDIPFAARQYVVEHPVGVVALHLQREAAELSTFSRIGCFEGVDIQFENEPNRPLGLSAYNNSGRSDLHANHPPCAEMCVGCPDGFQYAVTVERFRIHIISSRRTLCDSRILSQISKPLVL